MPTLSLRGRLLLAAVAIVSGSVAEGRTWTNDQGRRLEADFVRLRGRTAILDTGAETIRAPIERLSEADQEWIAAYRDLTRPRDWGADPDNLQRGRFQVLRDDGVQVKHGSTLVDIPFTDFGEEDWTAVEAIYTHLERELPEAFVSAKPFVEPPPTPPEDAPEREWVDRRGRKIVALYGGTEGGKALLWRGDKRFGFPIEQLSADDQAWIAEQGAAKLASDLSDSWAAAGELFAAAAAQTRGRRPPDFGAMLAPPPRPPAAQPPPEAAAPSPFDGPAPPQPPTDQEQGSSTAVERPPAASSGMTAQEAKPAVNHIDDLSYNEQERLLEARFGDLDDEDKFIGLATCTHCEGGFDYTADFQSGDACPFCQRPVTELITFEEFAARIEAELSGSSRPWYLRRSVRGIIIFLVISAIGGAVKLMTGGGGED